MRADLDQLLGWLLVAHLAAAIGLAWMHRRRPRLAALGLWVVFLSAILVNVWLYGRR